MLVKLKKGDEVVRYAARWSSPGNPGVQDIHPGTTAGCDLLRIDLNDMVPHIPADLSPLEVEQRKAGAVPPGGWYEEPVASGKYCIIVRIVAEDYESPSFMLGSVDVPGGAVGSAKLAKSLEAHRGPGRTLVWRERGGVRMEPFS